MASNESTDNKFNAQAFNKGFEEQKAQNKELTNQRIESKMDELNQPSKQKKLYELSMSEIIIKIKDSWFDLLDDIINNTFGIDSLTKDYRLFYLGITVFFFGCIFYIYNMLLSDNTTNNKTYNNESEHSVKKVYHIYNYDPQMIVPFTNQ